MSAEVWTATSSYPSIAPRAAARAEARGWDGILVVDSQNLAGDRDEARSAHDRFVAEVLPAFTTSS